LFGTAAVATSTAQDATQLPFAPERLFQLVAFLAVRGAWVAREQLTALLWPELPSDAARRNLRKLIFRAQRQLWFGAEVRADALRWQVESDVADFDAAVARADWARAVEGYGGVFLEGMEHAASSAFAEWLTFERTRLAAAFRDAAARRCDELRTNAGARADVASRWLLHDPFDEDALVVLVEALRASERTAEATRAQKQFIQRLTDTLAVAPSARVVALAAAPGAQHALRTAAAKLPATADLIGRRSEIQTLAGLLERSECQLLTIIGPGGIGKSRLARAAIVRVAQRYADGVHWIGLEDLADITQVAWRIAGVIGADIAGAVDPVERVIEGLRAQRTLLILDNSEHLADLPAFAARLLDVCPGVQLLATSRARLEVAGEWLLPLDGLPVPDEDETEADVLRAFDAVRLFEERAVAAAPAFASVENVADVARLVRLVEGMPLAIELAAPWIRVLPVREIADEIARSLDLLERAAPGLPDRQKSVRASFAHSWRLLSSREQAALARLSVFTGSFTRAAAAQVGDAELPILAGLVDRSLLRADGAGRFSFHALMHQCARERLHADPAGAAAQRQRHTEFFFQLLMRQVAPGIGSKGVLQEIEFWLADCRLAWSWLSERCSQPESLARLDAMTEPLMRFFEIKGRWGDGLGLLDAVEAGLRAAVPAIDAPAPLLAWRGALLFRKGDTQAALDAVTRGFETARATRRRNLMRLCLQVMGLAWWQQGAMRIARRSFERALGIAENIGDEAGRAPHLHGIAMCAKSEGDYDAAIGAYEQALALYRTSGSPQGEAMTLDNMALVARLQGDFAGARRFGTTCLGIAEEHGLSLVRTYALVNLGLIEIEEGNFAAAHGYLEQARAADDATGEGMVSVDIRLARGRLQLRTGHPEVALPLLRDGLAMARTRLDEPNQIAAIGAFAEYHACRGERLLAATYWNLIAGQPAIEAGEAQDSRRGLEALRLTAAEQEQAEQAARELTLEALGHRLLDSV
jgi:predicted ATPase/DNA-binding SARP family transcriptional activator/Tfp pilus assembly protein PilF